MARMFFGVDNCKGATSARSGRSYESDKQGFITVSDPGDIAYLKQGGYSVAGGMPKLKTYWECECGWEAAISSCPRCNRTDLVRVER